MATLKTQDLARQALSPARQLLAQALEAQQRAEVIAEKAEEVVQAATAAVEQARIEVSGFEGLDEDAVKARIAALKGEPGAKSLEAITQARRERTISQEELQAAEGTLRVAQRELEEARGNVTRAQKVCASHATSVLSEQITEVLREWGQVNEQRQRLHTILRSLILAPVALELYQEEQRSSILQGAAQGAGLPFGDWRDWQHLQTKIGEALAYRDGEPKDNGPALTKAKAYWKQFADAVLADPGAEPAPLPDAAELWG